MRIVITSVNPQKIAAVSQVFHDVVYGDDITIDTLPSKSGIPHGQPWGLQHTFEGAMARIADANFNIANQHTIDFIISVENGACTIATHTHTRYRYVLRDNRKRKDWTTNILIQSEPPLPFERNSTAKT